MRFSAIPIFSQELRLGLADLLQNPLQRRAPLRTGHLFHAIQRLVLARWPIELVRAADLNLHNLGKRDEAPTVINRMIFIDFREDAMAFLIEMIILAVQEGGRYRARPWRVANDQGITRHDHNLRLSNDGLADAWH